MGKGRVAYEKAWAWRIVFLALGAVAASGSAASVVAAKVDDDEASGSSVRQQPPAGAAFPFPYNWSKFPTAWFAANATDWESEAQLAEIGKYSMAILGWQHLAATTHWEAIVYTQIEQAAIIKKAHPGMPVFVYSGFGFAAGFNNGTWPALNSVLKDPKGSPYRDFFLQGSSKTVATQTYCQQGHTSTRATGDHCLSYVWNMANASARDYFLENVVAPLATSDKIDGVFYDGFNWGYILPAPWGTQTVNVPNCTNAGTVNPPPATLMAQGDSGFGCDALAVGSIDVALRTAQLLNKHGKVPMYSNPASFAKPAKTPIWMNELRLVDALTGKAWMVNYEFMRAESIMSGCPGAKVTTGECILNNMLTESKLGVAAGVHTYLQHVNKSDPKSTLESQLPHMAAFMLARQEHWYYFGSTGWWDDNYAWDALYDKASTCGKPTEPAPAVGSGPVYTRAFEHCKVTLDCTDSSFCKGDIKFLAVATAA